MAKQYLSFTLNNALFGIDVQHVREVLSYSVPVKIPCTAAYIDGLINSRNQGIIVINLRKKFHLPDAVPGKTARIIVLELATPSPQEPDHISIFGALADDVREVFVLNDEDIESVPKFGNTISAEYISGLGEQEGKFVVLLDMDKVFANTEKDLANAEKP